MIDTWVCDICGKERPDAKISVYKHDRSKEKGLPEGVLHENVKYCNDNYDCGKSAETFSFLREREEPVQEEKKEMSDFMKYLYTFLIFFVVFMVVNTCIAMLIQGNVTFMEKLVYMPGIFIRIGLAAYFSYSYAKKIFKS